MARKPKPAAEAEEQADLVDPADADEATGTIEQPAAEAPHDSFEARVERLSGAIDRALDRYQLTHAFLGHGARSHLRQLIVNEWKALHAPKTDPAENN